MKIHELLKEEVDKTLALLKKNQPNSKSIPVMFAEIKRECLEGEDETIDEALSESCKTFVEEKHYLDKPLNYFIAMLRNKKKEIEKRIEIQRQKAGDLPQ